MNQIAQIMGKSTSTIDKPAWAERLAYRRLIVLKRKSQTELALDVGVEQSSISLLESGKTEITDLPPYRLTAIAKAYGYRDIFEMQDDLGLDFKLGQPPPLLMPPTARDYPEFVVLDVEPLSAAASHPADIPENSRSEKYIMPLSDYRQTIRIFIADGDSMLVGEEGIHSGDALIVDTGDTYPREDEIFVIQDDSSSIVVKRLQKYRSEWWLTSDNTKYPPFQLDEAKILGRVLDAEGKRRLKRGRLS